jgi:hypothetical protein
VDLELDLIDGHGKLFLCAHLIVLYSFPSHSFLVCHWMIELVAASMELRGIMGCWVGLVGVRNGLPGAMVE